MSNLIFLREGLESDFCVSNKKNISFSIVKRAKAIKTKCQQTSHKLTSSKAFLYMNIMISAQRTEILNSLWPCWRCFLPPHFQVGDRKYKVFHSLWISNENTVCLSTIMTIVCNWHKCSLFWNRTLVLATALVSFSTMYDYDNAQFWVSHGWSITMTWRDMAGNKSYNHFRRELPVCDWQGLLDKFFLPDGRRKIKKSCFLVFDGVWKRLNVFPNV